MGELGFEPRTGGWAPERPFGAILLDSFLGIWLVGLRKTSEIMLCLDTSQLPISLSIDIIFNHWGVCVFV